MGLAPAGPDNPLAAARMPALIRMAGVSGLTISDQTFPPATSTDAARAERREGLTGRSPGAGGTRPDAAAPHRDAQIRRLVLAGLDATLGVPGLPQSATGQTALLTGVNASARLGKHFGPFPNAQLRELLASRSVWRSVVDVGLTAAFANAFPDRYLDRAVRGTGRMGAMARSAHLAGVRLRGPDDLRRGHAVSPFVTNLGWRTHLGVPDMPLRTPEEAGEILVRLAAGHSLTIYELYATDRAGHDQDLEAAVEWLEAVDSLCGAVLRKLPPNWRFVLVSDHGNVEDLTTPRHTRNPALLVTDLAPPGDGPGDGGTETAGQAASSGVAWARPDWSGADLTAVAPAMRRYLGLADGAERDTDGEA